MWTVSLPLSSGSSRRQLRSAPLNLSDSDDPRCTPGGIQRAGHPDPSCLSDACEFGQQRLLSHGASPSAVHEVHEIPVLPHQSIGCAAVTSNDSIALSHGGLNSHVVDSTTELQAVTDTWLGIYNRERPHDSLGRSRRSRFCRGHHPRSLRKTCLLDGEAYDRAARPCRFGSSNPRYVGCDRFILSNELPSFTIIRGAQVSSTDHGLLIRTRAIAAAATPSVHSPIHTSSDLCP